MSKGESDGGGREGGRDGGKEGWREEAWKSASTKYGEKEIKNKNIYIKRKRKE